LCEARYLRIIALVKIVADENIPFVRQAFEPLGNVVTAPGRQMTPEQIADADALLVRSVTKVNADLLDGSTVRFVGTATIGTDHLDTTYLDRRGITWAAAAGCNANSVAEHIVAALLVLARRDGFQLVDKTLGVVGVGNVGSRVVRYARALGMTVLENDPPLQRQTHDRRFAPIERIFEADLVTLHVPLTRQAPDATWHMVDTDFLSRLRADAYLLNTSRGAVVDGSALRDALHRQRLAGAVLDVWENEPDIDMELLELCALGTAHIAGYSFDGKVTGTRMIHDAACHCFGLSTEWDPRPLMPPPATPQLQIEPRGRDPPDVVASTVAAIYDIEKDDADLRAVSGLPLDQRASRFDRLRRDYPIRREFGNTRVIVPPDQPDLAPTFEKLGFLVG
jgi:erythronate-4-phosphate dehydrogenase